MEKINVAELLRDCPSGMKLDCTLVENLYFDRIIDSEPYDPCSIRCYTQTQDGSRAPIVFNEYGHFTIMVNSKCVIFPEGKTTWEGFQRPFKDGDIVFYKDTISIFKEWGDETSFRTHVCTYLCAEILDVNVPLFGKGIKGEIRYATEKEKTKLLDIIKDNGYKWNAETKTLEKLSEPKFKEGDILYCDANDDGEDKDMFKYIFIFDKIVDVDGTQFYYSHCHLFGNEFYNTETNLVNDYPVRYATEKEKQKLFQAIEDNGYKWNADTKTLEKSVELRFKVGDKIRLKENHNYIYTITGIREKENKYDCGVTFVLKISEQDNWELVPDKFDITTLVPFESRVLVRDTNFQKWSPAIWGFYDSDSYDYRYKLIGVIARYCIPYEGNEHLLGTTDDCNEFYKTWEKTGD